MIKGYMAAINHESSNPEFLKQAMFNLSHDLSGASLKFSNGSEYHANNLQSFSSTASALQSSSNLTYNQVADFLQHIDESVADAESDLREKTKQIHK